MSSLAAQADTISSDSTRGAQLFETQGCIQCHSANGKGGHIGPDLGRRVDRDYTPATLASLLWNHAPAMWSAMRERGIQPAPLTDQAAADLFAYFYSARFFEKPGDAGRGKRLFTERHCAECHGLTEAKVPAAKPVQRWESLESPVELVSAMWNHAGTMNRSALSAQDLTDMLVWLRNLPENRQATGVFRTDNGKRGKELFAAKCAVCHPNEAALTARLKGRTLTGIAAAMWNHEPRMMNSQTPASHLGPDEMRDLIGYLWTKEFFSDTGDAGRGRRVFVTKKCAVCHDDPASGAPSLARTDYPYTGVVMVTALWHHGPVMLERFREKQLAWPRFDGNQMSDLMGYLNTRKQERK